MKLVLLIMDAQNDFYEKENPNLVEFQRVIPTINVAIDLFRQHQLPIVFIQHTSQKKPRHSYSWEIYKEFDCRPEDVRMLKSYSNAFWESKLDEYLKSIQADFVVIAGFVAEYCVLSTYRGAQERGYKATILQDAIASIDNNRRTEFVFEISESISTRELTEILG